MICTCHSCHRAYWHYWDKNELPPSHGYCSVPCWEIRASRKSAGEDIRIPALPQAILARMIEHRRDVHQCASILGFFDCARCEELEGEYSASLDWHYRLSSAAMIGETQAAITAKKRSRKKTAKRGRS